VIAWRRPMVRRLYKDLLHLFNDCQAGCLTLLIRGLDSSRRRFEPRTRCMHPPSFDSSD
jgi:hypothetical protein